MTSALQQAGDQMDAALRMMTGGADGDQIGTDELNRATQDFQSTWQYGLGQLKQSLKDTDDGLKQAKSGYQQMEDALSQALNQVSSQEVQPLGAQIDQLAPNTGVMQPGATPAAGGGAK
ncbi:hypothetical protein [Streptacidiphilus fuscans]|uniref:Uncharacterized protein n=1 Tax=Streptacidiphilus fuscans TaxID=2789292 RepID=A0A931FF23_9ACTN|nr:hypothetical protein [Streptacidiphilus fuscans]MBF9072407.1 hypothetical protein [Streptacidiphilus fuscans]